MTDRLDAALADLAGAVEFPPTPDMRLRIADAGRVPRRRFFAPLPRALVLALIGLLVLAAAAAALVLSVPGLRLTLVPSSADRVGLSRPARDPAGARRRRSRRRGRQPRADALGLPDEAYVIDDGAITSLVYAAGDGLPELDGTDIGLLIQAFDGALDREQVEKLVGEVGVSVTAVSVDGADGYWIEGPPHLLRYLGPDGEARAEATRLVGDTLVWERDGTLYRIESGLGIDETLRIAETIEP